MSKEVPFLVPKTEIKQQIAFKEKRDGQGYFWEITPTPPIPPFPEAWATPNNQVDLFPSLNFRKKNETPPKKKLGEQLFFWTSVPEVPENYIELNKEHWKKVKRRGISKPMGLPNTSEAMHKRMVKTFNLKDATKTDLVWSVILDDPHTPSSRFAYAYRYPEDVADEDREDFVRGIHKITEYATNFATKEFLKSNMDFPGGRKVASAYGAFSDLLTYGILLHGTYSSMRTLEIMADHNGKDFRGSILEALFRHDFTGINEIIDMSKDYTGYSNINEMAIAIGRKRYKKPDFSKWIDKLDSRRSDGKALTPWKNRVISSLAPGVFRNPGITENAGGSLLFFPVLSTGIVTAILEANNVGPIRNFEHIPVMLPLIIPIIAELTKLPILTVISLIPYVDLHESTHHHSSDRNFMGLIPANIVSADVTPYKSRLEPAEEYPLYSS